MDESANHFLREALSLAETAVTLTSPNPRVGCVIVNSSGLVIGKGHTQRAGGPHAEIVALENAKANGADTRGATAYVTLEPCSHTGRTGPCTDALIAAGIQKVVASIADPNPKVSGKGFERLRSAGIALVVGPLAKESRELNIGFFSRMIRGTPWVRMKVASSLDGKTALNNGKSQWITSPTARADGHAWRARSCAVMTGIGTVLSDNPRLDVRLVPTERQPRLVLIDSRLETPLDASLFIAGRACQIYFAAQNHVKNEALLAKGAQLIHLPQKQEGFNLKVDLRAALQHLGKSEVNELHVEAGHKLNASLLKAGLVDELLVYQAPKLIGLGQGIADIGPFEDLSECAEMQFTSVQQLGEDIRILARFKGRDVF